MNNYLLIYCIYYFINVQVYFNVQAVLTFNLLCNKFIVKGHVMSIFGQGRPSIRTRSTLTHCSSTHMMQGRSNSCDGAAISI